MSRFCLSKWSKFCSIKNALISCPKLTFAICKSANKAINLYLQWWNLIELEEYMQSFSIFPNLHFPHRFSILPNVPYWISRNPLIQLEYFKWIFKFNFCLITNWVIKFNQSLLLTFFWIYLELCAIMLIILCLWDIIVLPCISSFVGVAMRNTVNRGGFAQSLNFKS